MSSNILNEKKKAKPDYLDFDNDNNKTEPMKKALKDKEKAEVAEELKGNQHKIDVAAPYGELTSADFKKLRKSKRRTTKESFSNWREDLIEIADKITTNKSEVPKIVEKEVNNKIEINPKIDLGEMAQSLGGTLIEMVTIEDFEGVFDNLSESEIFFLNDDLIENIVEEVFVECIQEGYDVLHIENTLLESLEISSSILMEAEVTYGHDTDVKKNRLEKVKSAVKKVGKGIARGAGYAAGLAVRGAKAVGREIRGGYQRGRYGSSSGSASGSSSSSASGSSSSSASGSSSDSEEKSGEETSDKKPGLLSRIGSKLKKGLKKIIHGGAKAVEKAAGSVARRTADRPKVTQGKGVEKKDTSTRVTQGKGDSETQDTSSRVTQGRDSGSQSSQPRVQAKTTTVKTEPLTKEQQQAVVRAQRRNPNLSKSDAERIASATPSKEERQREMRARMSAAASKRGLDEAHYSLATRKVEPGEPGEAHKEAIKTLAATARTKNKTRKPVGSSRRGGTFKPSSREEAQANQASWDDYWSSAAKGYKEEYELLEKAESEQQQKLFGLALSVKRGQTPRSEVSDAVLKIVDTMSEKKIRDFAKTKHEGIPHKVETKEELIRQELIARMVQKIEEQSEVYVDEAKLPSSMKKGKKKLESKTQVIHDVDDNLADQRHPDAAKIDLMRKKSGKWEKVKSLTPSQFAHHKLRGPGESVKEEKDDPGDKYGFNQFRDTEKFKKTTKANKPVVRLGDSPRRPAQKSVVTARGGSEFGSKKPSTPMDKPGEFAKDLNTRIGVKNLERKNVHFTGGMRKGSGPEKKAEVVKKIVKPDSKKVIATDDHLQNVRHMAAAASETAPKAKVRAYQSKPATKSKGKVKKGDIVPVRVGKEGDLSDTNIGIRKNTSPSSSTKETQRRRKTAKRGMRSESTDVNTEL